MSVIKSEPIKCLDHGFVRFVEAWGHGDVGSGWERSKALPNKAKEGERGYPDSPDFECGIIEAARQSTQGSFRGWVRLVRCPKCGREMECENKPAYCNSFDTKCNVEMIEVHSGDQRLLTYLFSGKPQHATPFEFSGMTIEVRAPIFVFREWHRHRTQSYNEMSARYAPLPAFDYTPSWENLKERGEKGTKNKQASGTYPWNEVCAQSWWRRLPDVYSYLEKVYNDALLAGVPKELARIILPVGRYSQMRASGNLRNWLAFVTLRSDPNAQEEIRVFSQAIEQILAECFPRTYELFLKRRLG